MTVYEWLISKDNIVVEFNKIVDGDYTEILEIKIDLDCECPVITNSDYTLTRFPITTIRTFYNDQIPNNDAALLHILNEMHQELITMLNKIKYQNK